MIDLSSAPDLFLCADQLDPGVVVNCAAKTVSRLTDVNGQAVFTILGGSNGSGNASTLMNGGKIFANGTLIGVPTVSAFDLDGAAGVGANDLSLWLRVFGSATMTSSCGATCP